jgi:hypothetical protein
MFVTVNYSNYATDRARTVKSGTAVKVCSPVPVIFLSVRQIHLSSSSSFSDSMMHNPWALLEPASWCTPNKSVENPTIQVSLGLGGDAKSSNADL